MTDDESFKSLGRAFKDMPVHRCFFLASFAFLMFGVSTGNNRAFGAAITLAIMAVYLERDASRGPGEKQPDEARKDQE